MTIEEFNEKYKDFLETGHYGISINNKHVISFLDFIFEKNLVNRDGFKYQQIKTKFGMSRFYSTLSQSENSLIETMIDKILKESDKL